MGVLRNMLCLEVCQHDREENRSPMRSHVNKARESI